MKSNIGEIDKIIRIVIGLAAIAVGFYYKSVWGMLGIIPILTALTGRCGLYVPLNIDTTEKK
ncbi:MAG: DUF2892 domain-containing protein [Fidelibacterota bacterium]